MPPLPTTRTVILAQSLRAPGEYVTPSWEIDADQDGVAVEITVQMPPATANNTGTNLRYALQLSPDDSVWRDVAVIEFRGHASAGGEDDPGMQIAPMTLFQGQFIRALLTVRDQSTNAGCRLRVV